MFLEYNKRDCFNFIEVTDMKESLPNIRFLGYVHLNSMAVKNIDSLHTDRISPILGKFETICIRRMVDGLYYRCYLDENINLTDCELLSTILVFFKDQKEFLKYKLAL